jgi:AAT family amino acid transporter
MVVVLVNFQGIEILGLAAAETQHAETAVPKACKTATLLIMGMYLIPIIIILGIFPTGLSTLDGAIFAQVLSYYHLDFWAALLSAAVLFASFSCANTGLYGTVRCLYSLATEGLAPQAFGKLDKHSSPRNAVLFSLCAMWIVLMLGFSSGGSKLYESLLSVAGFTGATAWMGIILSQFRFRKRLVQNGYDPQTCLRAAVPQKQKWLSWYALIGQAIALVMLAFGEGQQIIFLIACLAIIIPIVVSLILRRCKNTSKVSNAESDVHFDTKFPPKQ